jgi:hypothetical protein
MNQFRQATRIDFAGTSRVPSANLFQVTEERYMDVIVGVSKC